MPQLARTALALLLLLTLPARAAVDATPSLLSFLRGEYGTAAAGFEQAWKQTKNLRFRNLYVLSLVGRGDTDRALNELVEISKTDAGSDRGVWLEGEFLRAAIYQMKGQEKEARALHDLLLGAGSDPVMTHFYLGQLNYLRKDFSGAIEQLRETLDRHHAIEPVSRFLLAASFYQLSLSDPTYVESAHSQLSWLVQHAHTPELTRSYEQLLHQVEAGGSYRLKPYDDPLSLMANLFMGASNKAYIPDYLYGFEPQLAVDGFAMRAGLQGNLSYRLYRWSDHQIHAGYSGSVLTHFSTQLFPYDHVIHGPLLFYRTRILVDNVPVEIEFHEQFVDMQTDLSRIRHALYGNLNDLRFNVPLSANSVIGGEFYFSYGMYQDFSTGDDPLTAVKGLANSVVYSSGMSGIRYGFAAKFWEHYPDFDLTAHLGFQQRIADNSTFSSMSPYTALTFWFPVRWRFDVGLHEKFSFDLQSSAARGQEIYSSTHALIRRHITSESHVLVDAGYTIRTSETSTFQVRDFNTLLYIVYTY